MNTAETTAFSAMGTEKQVRNTLGHEAGTHCPHFKLLCMRNQTYDSNSMHLDMQKDSTSCIPMESEALNNLAIIS